MSISSEQLNRLAIREVLENWAVWRDAGDWERFRSVWHDDGRMMATWFQGTADEFIQMSREGFERALLEAVRPKNVGLLIDALHLYRSGAGATDLAGIDPTLFPYMHLCDALAPPVARGFAR